jgi:DNA polymerase III subunit delta
MAQNPPAVYILHGEDEYAITQYLAGLTAKLGDSAMAEMNTLRLDGKSTSLEELEAAVMTLPFLVKRRMVILSHPKARANNPGLKTKFKKILESVPPAVALVLVEYGPLTTADDRKKKRVHWLETWGYEGGSRVLMKLFNLPRGREMIRRIQEQAKALDGQISNEAAELLASLVGDSPRTAEQEIHKLLAYTGYKRMIELEDVNAVTADQGQGDIFAMVDAIGMRNRRTAIEMLHRLLSAQDAITIFGMVVRQFRLLIMLKDFVESGGQMKDAPRELGQPPFVIEKLVPQLRSFDLATLENIYRRLLNMDEAAKSGGMDMDLALDALIAEITR